jgi:hypothetical protein
MVDVSAKKINIFLILWWVGAPILIGLSIWAPYWVLNASAGVPGWWRIQVLPSGIFDTYAYLQWIGQVANGLDIGGQFRWFEWPLRALAWLMIPRVSIPELWFVTRWISTVTALWVGG